MKTRTKSIILAVVGILLLVLGIIFLTLFKTLIKDEVHEQVVLKQGTDVFDGWKDTPFPILFKFWFFNCTNCKDEFKDPEFKPNLTEVGPYTLEMEWDKRNFLEYDYKMQYDSFRTFRPSKEFTNPDVSFSDTIVMPNVIALVVGYLAEYFTRPEAYNSNLKWECDFECKLNLKAWFDRCKDDEDMQPYIDMNVGEFLIEGVKSKCILEVLHDISEDNPDLGIILPETFSVFGSANTEPEGTYVVYTGEDDLTKRSFVYTFDGDSTNGDAWKPEDSVCNAITGTDGQLWIPFATKEDKVSIWSGDIKRSLPFLYDEDVRVKGAFGYSYAIREDAFDNSQSNPENSCYEHDGVIRPNGVYHYRDPFPLAISHPHYLYADSHWTDQINGMNPDEAIHRSKFVVEPVTGVPLEVKINLQANFHVFRVLGDIPDEIDDLGWRHLKDYYHPLLWFSTYSLVDQDTADGMVLLTEDLEVIINAIGGCLVAIGGALILAVPVLIHFVWERRGRKQSSSS